MKPFIGYIYLFIVALMFSFGGTWVKLIQPYFDSAFITFFRFVIGVLWLLLLKRILQRSIRVDRKACTKYVLLWAFIGGAAKWLAYLCENYGLSHGNSYGNIVLQPAQMIFVTFASVLLFKEKLTPHKWFGIFLCLSGVLLISWNGRPLSSFWGSNVFLTVLYLISGAMAGLHIVSQKMTADRVNMLDGNLLTFLISGALAFLPVFPRIPGAVPVSHGLKSDMLLILALVMFGCNTGVGFFLNAKAIKLVPLYIVPIIQSTMVFFSILWGVLFFHETITGYTIGGTLLFVIGIITVQLRLPAKSGAPD